MSTKPRKNTNHIIFHMSISKDTVSKQCDAFSLSLSLSLPLSLPSSLSLSFSFSSSLPPARYDQWRCGSEKSCKVSKTLFDLRGNRNWSKKLRRAITKFKQKQNSAEIWANLRWKWFRWREGGRGSSCVKCNILDYIQSGSWGTRWRGKDELWGGKSWGKSKRGKGEQGGRGRVQRGRDLDFRAHCAAAITARTSPLLRRGKKSRGVRKVKARDFSLIHFALVWSVSATISSLPLGSRYVRVVIILGQFTYYVGQFWGFFQRILWHQLSGNGWPP